MTKHTPGPWKGYAHTGYVYGPDCVVAVVGGFTTDKDLIPTSGERWAADAALIAAAPDLLHILEVIRDADRDCGKDGLPHNLPPAIRAMVDAAIAKASGDPTP
jgi:hypothetical protein